MVKDKKPNPKSTSIQWINIDKIIDPWGNSEKVKEEVRQARERLSEHPESFHCKKCNDLFQPAPLQWIYYSLCDACFKKFDTQKMMGRRGTLSKKGAYAQHFEDVDKWIKQVEN